MTPHPSLPGARTLLAKHTQQPPSNAVTWGRLLRGSVAQWVTPFRAAYSVPLAHHSGLNAGKPQMAVCRNEFIDTFDFVNNTFVQAMRAFLGCVRDS